MTSSDPKCRNSKNTTKQCNFERFMILYGTCALILSITIFEISVLFIEVFEGFTFYLNCAFSIFLDFNMIGNLILCSRVDTSISYIKNMVAGGLEKLDSWKFCEKCNALTPPRSRHCNDCNVCILKRDHHCFITGCCVGHYNYRYFMAFVAYVAIATAYAISLNIIYFWWIGSQIYGNFYKMLCFVFPVFILFQWKWDDTGLSFDWNALHILVFLINAVAFLVVLTFLYCHIQNLMTGATYHENEKNLYNLGSWHRNVEMAFGKNWHSALVSPFIKSKLPHDGIQWSPVLEEVAIKKL